MQENESKNALERLLNLFTEVRAGEGATALLLTLNAFLILMAYYIAKVVREPLIIVGGGAELKSYFSAGQLLLLFLAVRGYAWLAARFPRKRLINIVNIFFSANLALFYVFAILKAPIGIVFFLWVGMFNVMVVAQFWSFANDIYTPEEGKRLFPMLAFGTAAGAVCGAKTAGSFIPVFGLYQLLLVAAGVLLLSLLITNIVNSRLRVKSLETSESQPKEDEAFGKEGAFRLVFANKYLLGIAFLVLLLNWVNTTGEYILSRTVQDAAKAIAADSEAQKAFVGQFYADFFFVVNLAEMIIQLFLVSRILKYFGIRVAILILPVIALGGYFIYALYPILNIVRGAKIAENSTDYSLNNTVRHALYLPTRRDEKFKAKQAIDSFFHRSGDVLSALVVFVGFELFGFEPKDFAIINLALVAVWLFLAFKTGQANKRLVEA